MTLSRRRFLRLASAACLTPCAVQAYQWQGIALGAHAQIILDHPRAKEITQRAIAEISRLESIFSLYRPNSEILRLNATGDLAFPSFEMLECLGIVRHVHSVTEGRFDPTVQPLWRVLAEATATDRQPDPQKVKAAQQVIGFNRVAFDQAAVTLAPGQKLTLNGVAQGYIADCVARLMREEGVEDVLIDTGEILALGAPTGRNAWPVTIAGEPQKCPLRGRALATSAPFGTVMGPSGQLGHILDPRRGGVLKTTIRQISISAPRAAFADALSTALCVVTDQSEIQAILRKIKDVRLENIQTKPKTT